MLVFIPCAKLGGQSISDVVLDREECRLASIGGRNKGLFARCFKVRLGEFQAECAGTLAAVLAENGDPVEYGQKLFKVVSEA